MTFEELEQGSPIIITVKEGNRQTTLESKIINQLDGVLIADPFLAGGAIVQFSSRFDIELLVLREGDIPVYFQKVYIDQQIYHDNPCHTIRTNLPGIKYNRRSSFRVPLTAPVKVNNGEKTSWGATLKDLSSASFSILVEKSRELPLHKKITVEYTDHSIQKYFEFSGHPIRKAELQNYTLYGCLMERRLPELDNYLAQKQLENRRRKE